MENRDGNEVVENKIVCLAKVLLAEISVCYSGKMLAGAGRGQFFKTKKKEVSPNLHFPSYSPCVALFVL